MTQTAFSTKLKNLDPMRTLCDFFYDLRWRDVRFRQRSDIMTMSRIYMPFHIMKVGDEFYMKGVSLEFAEKKISKISVFVRKRFVVLEDEDLIKVIRIR